MDTSEWRMSDMLDELRGKFHLKNKDADAYRERTYEAQRENERIIAKLRQENWNKRIVLAQHENGDLEVIKTVFAADKDRLERLRLQRHTASGAIEEMDGKVCEGGKVLNMMRYGREMREAKLKELQEELDRMLYLSHNSADQNTTENAISVLENSMDKASIKHETALNISRRYEDILVRLKEDSLTLPAKLDAMEKALLHEKAELKELRQLSKEAIRTRDLTKRQCADIEMELHEEKLARDALLKKTNSEVNSRKAEAGKIERRLARNNFSNTDQDALSLASEQDKVHNTKKKILTCEDAYRMIRIATNVEDMDEVICRIKAQKGKTDGLNKQLSELEYQRERVKEEIAKLGKQFTEMKYSGEQEVSRGQAVLAKLLDLLDKEEASGAKTDEDLVRAANVLVSIRSGVSSLLTKLDEVKLRAPEHNYTQGDVFDQMDLCWKKMEHLLARVNEESRRLHPSSLQCPVFQKFLEEQLPADNIRVKIESKDEKQVLMPEYSFEATQNAPTRQDIKKDGQRLIESKVNPKKRRSRKK